MGNYGCKTVISAENELEKQFLNNLQLLSENISDLINKRDFSKVKVLDKERQIIIKSFNHKLSENSKESLIKILEQNKNLIHQIENEKRKLQSNYKKVFNIFNAYK